MATKWGGGNGKKSWPKTLQNQKKKKKKEFKCFPLLIFCKKSIALSLFGKSLWDKLFFPLFFFFFFFFALGWYLPSTKMKLLAQDSEAAFAFDF